MDSLIFASLLPRLIDLGSPGTLVVLDQLLVLALILVRLGIWGGRPRGWGRERNEISKGCFMPNSAGALYA